LIISRFDQQQRHRQAYSPDGLCETNKIRMDTCIGEAEELAGTAAARLNIVDDQQRSESLCNRGKFLEPFRTRNVKSTFALDRLDDERCGSSSPPAGSLTIAS
jgi:hypothetical protein